MAENNHQLERKVVRRRAPKNHHKWTVMVYLAGDNNLTANCISVLQQLEAVNYERYDDSLNVLACFDSNTPWPKGSRYLTISHRRHAIDNGMKWEIHNDLVPPNERGHDIVPPSFCAGNEDGLNGQHQRRPEVAEGLRRFLNWAMNSNGTSDRYMLILYGHGPVVAGQSFLGRDNPPSSLLLADLKKILGGHFGPDGKHRKLDILAFQNCVMNGVEIAYEVQDHVKYMIGSQGLVLATGWPYERILSALIKKPDAPTEEVAGDLLKACARNLLDFSIMDRSSEQAVCNVERVLTGHDETTGENIVTAVRKLASAMRAGLAFEDKDDKKELDPKERKEGTKDDGLKYPVICDAIRLARLEAQTYWAEIFVDLYDFCERLVKRCDQAVITQGKLLGGLGFNGDAYAKFKETDLLKILKRITTACIDVMHEIEGTKDDNGELLKQGIVEKSYFIGADLQYSHGLSIFFPWTLPTEPYFFTKSGKEWVLRTAFETYRSYEFANHSSWSDFLVAFFKATLRKVRRSDRDFIILPDGQLAQGLVQQRIFPPSELPAIDLQKSSSDTGKVDRDVWSTIKNYPRRNYLNPLDCKRKVDEARVVPCKEFEGGPQQPPVSYLGWNITGLVAEVIGVVGPARNPLNGGGNGDDEKAVAAVGGPGASKGIPCPDV